MRRIFTKLPAASYCPYPSRGPGPGPVNLSGSSYIENFNGVSSGLPAGFSVRTLVNPTSPGTNAILLLPPPVVPPAGTGHYRLRQVDKDNKFSFSPVVAVRFGENGQEKIRLFPNPVTDFMSLADWCRAGHMR